MANPAHAFALSGSNLISFHPSNADRRDHDRHHQPDRRRNAGRHRFPSAERNAVRPRRQRRGQHRDALCDLDANRLCRRRSERPGRSPSRPMASPSVDLPDPGDRRLRLRLQSGGRPHSRHDRHRPELPDQSEHRRGGRRRRRWRHDGTNPDGAINTGTTTRRRRGLHQQPAEQRQRHDAVHAGCGRRNSLFIQNPPNAGTQTLGQTVTLNGNPLDFTSVNGFDIAAGVNAATSNTPVTSGSAFAVLTVGGATGLYSINLVNGAATLVGNVVNGATPVAGPRDPEATSAAFRRSDFRPTARTWSASTRRRRARRRRRRSTGVGRGRRDAVGDRFPSADRAALCVRRQRDRQHRNALPRRPADRRADDRRRRSGQCVRVAGGSTSRIRRRRLRHRLQSDGRPHPRHDRHRPQLPHQSEQRPAGGRDHGRWRSTAAAPPAFRPPPTPTASASRCPAA